MFLTAELSLYPLKDDFEKHIIRFIRHLKSLDNIEVYTHSMSTFIKGEKTEVMNAVSESLDRLSDLDSFSIVIKAINRNLPVESGFIELS